MTLRLAGHAPPRAPGFSEDGKTPTPFTNSPSGQDYVKEAMPRDSLLGERIVWVGRPKAVETPAALRVVALFLFALSAVSLCFSVVIAFSLHVTPTEPLLLAGWTSVFGSLVLQAPKIWLEGVEYLVTERHVVMQRGPFRRTIERKAISFARIRWSSSTPGAGDLDLVRAVPTGALRRRLLLQMRGVAAPDRLFAIIRGVENSSEPHRGDRPLTQRLDDGEHVVWSARPRPTLLAYVPRSRRELGVLALSAVLFYTFGTMLARSVPNLHHLASAGLRNAPLAALLLGEGISALLVLGCAVYFLIDGLVAPAKKLAGTRYLITNRRVLIQQGREELHLDRSRIVDVIPTRTQSGLSDVFLVLDGPRARAVAMGGAFGERETSPHLRPVLVSVEDAEGVSRILMPESQPARRAA